MARGIRVLQVINDLNFGGAQRIVADLATHTTGKEFEPIVFNLSYLSGKIIEEEIRGTGVEIVNFSPVVIGDFRCIWPIYRTIKSRRIKIVHTHLCLASFYGTIAARLAGVRAIVSTEHNTSTFASRPWLYRLAARSFLSLNTRAIAVSEAIRQLIAKNSPRLAAKTQVIHNGVDLEVFDPGRYTCSRLVHRSARQSKKLVVGTLVRDDPRKGFFCYLACAERLESQYPEIVFTAGTRDDSRTAQCLHAYRLKQGVAEYLAGLDVFVLPSLEEGLGLAAIEAMAMGKPIVASNTGGLKEVVSDGLNGLLVEPGNVGALAEAILTLHKDRRLAKEFGSRGRRIAQSKFALTRMVAEVEALYHSMI